VEECGTPRLQNLKRSFLLECVSKQLIIGEADLLWKSLARAASSARAGGLSFGFQKLFNQFHFFFHCLGVFQRTVPFQVIQVLSATRRFLHLTRKRRCNSGPSSSPLLSSLALFFTLPCHHFVNKMPPDGTFLGDGLFNSMSTEFESPASKQASKQAKFPKFARSQSRSSASCFCRCFGCQIGWTPLLNVCSASASFIKLTFHFLAAFCAPEGLYLSLIKALEDTSGDAMQVNR
jgi:hypothetical protein